MKTSRRWFLGAGAAGLATVALGSREDLFSYAAARGVKFKVGVTDWNLRQEGKTEAVSLASRLGFDGVQVSLGIGAEKLPLADPAMQAAYRAESKRTGLPLASVCLNILHRNYLKSDPLGQRWVADAIPIAKNLGVRVILLPFFGRGALQTEAEMDYVGDALREIAPAAEKFAQALKADVELLLRWTI